MDFVYPCLTYKQRDDADAPTFCIFSAPASEIEQWSDVNRLGPDNRQAAQRLLNPTRVDQVRKYFAADGRNTIPTALLVAFGPAVVVEQDEGAPTEKVKIEVVADQSKPALIIDGQHRLFGARAYHDADVRLNVIGLLGADEEEQAFQFLVINNKSHRVPKSHITALQLNYPVDQLNARLLKSVRMGLDEQLHTLLKVADEDAESPFRGKLAWETNTDADQWVAPSAIEQSFRIIRAADRKDLDEDTWIDFYLTVWIAVHEEWGDIWQDPRTEPDAAGREYRLLQKVGIITLFTFLCERLFAKADDLDSPLNLGDLESVKDFVRRTLQGLDPHFFSAKWKLGEFDTRQGRDRILRALRMIPQYKRANVDWREEIDFIDEPEAQRPRAP